MAALLLRVILLTNWMEGLLCRIGPKLVFDEVSGPGGGGGGDKRFA